MHFKSAIAIGVLFLCNGLATAQDPPPGPYYFVSQPIADREQVFWENSSRYAGVRVHENYNLLATVLGDVPAVSAPMQALVAPQDYNFGSGTVLLQPFAFFEKGSTGAKPRPIGDNLNRFLNDPLKGSPFDLTLPFRDPHVGLSDNSALMRGGTWHTAVDFDRSDGSHHPFDVIAPADGFVHANGASGALCLRHVAANGTEFLTIYQHMVPDSKLHLVAGEPVRRGEYLGRVEDWRPVFDEDAVWMRADRGYTHLHFGVAVKGPQATVNGTVVPELWYLIDPFGVYDYRRNRGSDTDYNYLPNNTLERNVKGVRHAYVWRTDPVIGSLLLEEECIKFDPSILVVHEVGGKAFLATDAPNDSDKILRFIFPDTAEAQTALAIIQHYGINKISFFQQPDSDAQFKFQFLLKDISAPEGSFSGEDCISFDPSKVFVRKALIGYEIFQPKKPPVHDNPIGFDGSIHLQPPGIRVLSFGSMLEAGNALSIIRKYGFTRVCFVGQTDPSLTYLRK